MTPVRHVAIIGAGAMGAYYAAKFYEMDPESVSLVAEGPRLERLAREGLVVNGKAFSPRVVSPREAAPPPDLILVAVKHHHLESAVKDMGPLVGEGTILLSVMNGIESEERLGEAFGRERVLYAVAVGIDAVRDGNRVTYSQEGRLFLGEARNSPPSPQVRRVTELLERARIPHEVPEDMLRVLWWKFMINVAVNQVSAVLRAPYGVFQRSAEARELADSVMREVIRLARVKGIDLSEEDIENWNVFLGTLAPEGKTSMLQDVEAGRKTEVEMFAGKVLQEGRTLGIPTPINEVLYRQLRVIEGTYSSTT